MRLIPSVFVLCLVACSSSGDGSESPMCSADTDTDTDHAHNFMDGIGLGVVGIDAYRNAFDGDVSYQFDMHGDQEAVTQITLTYQGMPVVGMEYPATESPSNDEVGVLVLPVSQAPDLVTGTVTFTEVGTADGENLALDMRLEFTSGTLEGCTRSTIVASTDDSTSGGSGSDTADSSTG
jgi:hypothetical protein